MMENRLICQEYSKRIDLAAKKDDIFKILCDANGVSFIAECQKKGIPLPYEAFKQEFAAYVNGKRVMTFNHGVTSKMYIDYTDEITADTTLLSLVRCKADVTIPNNKYPRIVLDKDCDVVIRMGAGSRLILDAFEGARYDIVGDQTRARINNK